MSIAVPTPWLNKAGRFDIEHIGGIPHFNQAVYLKTPRTGILHTTEGSWTGSLAIFKHHFAPHFILGRDDVQNRVRIGQLVQVGTIGAALRTHNWLAIVQIEMIGYSKEELWIPDETAEALASLMAVCQQEYGIPLSRPWPDGVYGMASASDPHRSEHPLGTVAGWYGHGDCPAPDSHWDPGDLAWSRIFAMAKAVELAAPVPSPPTDLQSPCGTINLDADLVTAVGSASAATKIAILKELSHG